MDWTGCELVEVIPGKVSGVPLVVGTRIPANIILEYMDSDSGLEELAEDFPSLSIGIVRLLATFAASKRQQTSVA